MKRLYFILLSVLILLFIPNVCTASESQNISSGIVIRDFSPNELLAGEVVLSILVLNNGTEDLQDFFASVSINKSYLGDSNRIRNLSAGKEALLFVDGKADEIGNLDLEIEIKDEKFYKKVNVLNSSWLLKKRLEGLQDSQLLVKRLMNISARLDKLKLELKKIKEEIENKEYYGYDISTIDVESLEMYINEIEGYIINEDVNHAYSLINIAEEDYTLIEASTESARKISWINKMGDYFMIFLWIAGGAVAVFLFFEIWKIISKRVEKTAEKIANKKKRK